jgi:hypothetical protein
MVFWAIISIFNGYEGFSFSHKGGVYIELVIYFMSGIAGCAIR